MKLEFEPIDLERQSTYLQRLQQCPQQASDYSFVNLWGWAAEYGLSWSWQDELVWIKQARPREMLWAPVGPCADVDWGLCLEKVLNGPTTFIRVPDGLLQFWQAGLAQRLTAAEARGHWDYLYQTQELIELKGNRFHKKKNLLNQFIKKYDYAYVTLDASTIGKALEMQTDWCTWRDCESSDILSAENQVIARILHHWPRLTGLTGGALLVEGTMAAYTVAERFSADTLLIHFEKGSPDYKGVYQAINQMFLEHEGPGFALVNREQDLDDDGLRKAKLSYNPADFLRKHRVVIA